MHCITLHYTHYMHCAHTGLAPDRFSYGAMVDGYAKRGDLEAAERFSDGGAAQTRS